MFVQNTKKGPKRVMGYAVPPAEMVDYSFLKLMAVSGKIQAVAHTLMHLRGLALLLILSQAKPFILLS